MAKRSVSGKGSAGQRPSGPALHDSTIALSESLISKLEVPSGPPRPPPGRRAAPVPDDASLWPGQVVLADDFAAVPPRRPVGRWFLAGAVAVAALAGGVVAARPWWDKGAPAATPPPAPAAVAAPVTAPSPAAVAEEMPAAASPAAKSPTVTRSVKRSKTVSTSKSTSTKRGKRVTPRKRTTRAR